MTATLNDRNLLSCSIQEPRIGVWSAVVDVDSDEAITGQVTLTIDGISWVGTVIKGDLHAGRFSAQLVGGAGKLATVLGAKHYRGVPLAVVLDDLMMGTGERLSSTTTTDLRSHTVARWSRLQGKAAVSLKAVADELSLTWRVLRDGTIWLGTEQWTEAKPDAEEINRVPGRDSVTIAPESPLLGPGTTFLDRRVSRVTTSVKDGALRQEVLFESPTGGSRVSEDLTALVAHQVDRAVDYSRMYAAKVLAQAGDGSLELLPDAEKLRGTGLTRVPIRHGIPGVRVTVPSGGKVLLFFENADPKFPAAALWPDGSAVTQIKITAPTLLVEGNIECTGEITAKSQSAPVTLSGHLHPSATGPVGRPTPGT